MKVHYLQHVPFEGPGYIETWASQQGHQVSGTRLYEENYSLPDPDDVDVLVIMGGPMGVYDDDKFSWLGEEKRFIQRIIRDGKIALGICLGAQLLAVCLGAKVDTALHKEIGWFPVVPTSECAKVGWFHDLFTEQPVVFHWHGDQFDIPPDGAINLLSSVANKNQAFIYKEKVLGLQFHLEVMHENIKQLLDNCRHELVPSAFIQSEAKILHSLEKAGSMNTVMAAILKKLFADDVNKM